MLDTRQEEQKECHFLSRSVLANPSGAYHKLRYTYLKLNFSRYVRKNQGGKALHRGIPRHLDLGFSQRCRLAFAPSFDPVPLHSDLKANFYNDPTFKVQAPRAKTKQGGYLNFHMWAVTANFGTSKTALR